MSFFKECTAETKWLLQALSKGESKKAMVRVMAPTAPEVWKLAKYVVIGVVSVVVFYAAYGLFRLIVEYGLKVKFSENRMLWNSLSIFVAFVPTNWFTYVTNRRWVFVHGKHDSKREFALFTAAAAGSFLLGELGILWVMRYYAISDLAVTLVFIALSTLFNYAFRKYVVFHG